MKNIHILPTDKPSRFYKRNSDSSFDFSTSSYPEIGNSKNQNIYVTSDEEINQQTKPCWCINTIKSTWDDDLIYYQGSMPQYHYIGFKKIILTDNQDLITDGVQSIDDEFLEFIVKNPSCERVEVKKGFADGTAYGYNFLDYKIIIPKEEPTIVRLPTYYEPKQETLEEVRKVERTELFNSIYSVVKKIPRKDVDGDAMDAISCAYEIEQLFYEWQQQSYSEEDMKQFAWECVANFLSNSNNKVEMALVEVIMDRNSKQFEQFKKK